MGRQCNPEQGPHILGRGWAAVAIPGREKGGIILRMTTVVILATVFPFAVSAIGTLEQTASSTGPTDLVIWANEVHKQVADGSAGGDNHDLAAVFEKKYNVKLEWVTIPWAQMRDRVLRELSASSGPADLVFVENSWASPRLLDMFTPLDPYMNQNPIEDMADIPTGMMQSYSINGRQMLIPYRSNLELLHYNSLLLDSYGLKPPTTMVQLGKDAIRITHRRSDGEEVYGFAYIPDQTDIEVIRAFGGDVFDRNMNVTVDSPEAVRAVKFLRELYVSGAIPPNFSRLNSTSYRELYTGGLLGFIMQGDNYYLRFNDPKNSRIAGHSGFSAIPLAKGGPAIAKLAFWGVGIPRNAPVSHRELAYDFIRYFSTLKAQTAMALNGNDPVRSEVYENPEFQKRIPYAKVAEQVLPKGKPLLPAFEGTNEVSDIMKRQVGLAITGKKSAEQALVDAKNQIVSVLKREGVVN